tara:strand:+ start:139 stop:387 length:249 start_codon:yes stop_codon:yes gene_type:complete
MTIDIKDKMEDCITPTDFELYFKEYNDESPKVYCELALRKLNNLDQEKKNTLLKFLASTDINNGWYIYCHTLTKEQIEYVGW